MLKKYISLSFLMSIIRSVCPQPGKQYVCYPPLRLHCLLSSMTCDTPPSRESSMGADHNSVDALQHTTIVSYPHDMKY